MARRIALLAAGLLVFVALPAHAGDDARGLPGHNVRVSFAPASEETAAVAHNPTADEYLVVWADPRDFTNRAYDVWGRFLDGDGIRLGPEFRISGPAATLNADSPDVAYDSCHGTFLVVWSDWRNFSARGPDIYGQRIAADHSFIGWNFRVSGGSGATGEFTPAVAAGAANRFLVVWSDGRDGTTAIYGRHVPAVPGPLDPDIRVSGPVGSDKSTPDVAYDGFSNEFLVAWHDNRNLGTTGWDVYAQRVSVIAGSPVRLGHNVRISLLGAVGDDWEPSVAAFRTGGGYLVVWGDGRADRSVYGQRVHDDGTRIGVNFRIPGGGAGPVATTPSVAALDCCGVKQWLVAWIDDRRIGTRGMDVYTQRLGTGGGGLGHNVRTSGAGALGDELMPDAAAGDGEWLVVWGDGRNQPTTGQDVYAQRVTPGP